MTDTLAVADAGSAPLPKRGGRMPQFKRQKVSWRDTGLAVLFLAPSLAVFVVFFYLPFFKAVRWGNYRTVRAGQAYRYVGLSQYHQVLAGHEFHDGLVHSIQFVVLTVPAGLILGVLLGVAAHRRLKGIKAFQTIFSSTLASSVAVSSVVFFFLVNPTVGFFQYNWRNEQGPAMVMAAMPTIWQNLGLAFVIVLAGLQAVPDEVLEAATLDGFGPIRRLYKITLPLISPVLLFLFVILTIQGFQAFAQIDIITGGGPAQSTETVVYKIFNLAHTNYGQAAAMSVGLFFVTFIVTAIQFLVLDRRVHYGN